MARYEKLKVVAEMYLFNFVQDSDVMSKNFCGALTLGVFSAARILFRSRAPGAEVWPEPCDHPGGEQAGQAGDPGLLNSMDFGNSCGEKDENSS